MKQFLYIYELIVLGGILIIKAWANAELRKPYMCTQKFQNGHFNKKKEKKKKKKKETHENPRQQMFPHSLWQTV